MHLRGRSSEADHSSVLVLIERADRSRYYEGSLPILREAGYDVGLVTVLPAGKIHKALSEDGIRVASLGCHGSAQYPRGVAKLARIIRQQKPDLIHAHEPIPGVIAGAARRVSGVHPHLLLHRHHSEVFGVQRALSRVASGASDRTLGVSLDALDAAGGSDHVMPDRQSLAWNGVPELRDVSADEIRALRSGLGLTEECILAVTVARLRPEKGLLTLINAMSRVEDERIHLAIVGDGPLCGELGSAVSGASLVDRVHLVGERSDVAPWYRAAEFVVVPSLSEPFGLVAIEAGAAERPVIASHVGGLSESIVGGETGLHVPPGDAVSLARAISCLAENPEERSRLGTAGRSRYEELFTIDAMAQRWIDGYEVALADPH